MNGEKNFKRGWVKDAAIIFLAVMLVLTFFSKTIMNFSLPEVSGQYARYGTVATSVRGTGTVKTNMPYGVQLSRSRKVKQVLVKVGSEVEADDVLLILEDDESDELTAAREELANLEYSYRQLLLNAKTVSTEDSLEIINLREDLNKAYAELEAVASPDGSVQAAKTAVKELESKIKSLEREITALTEKVSDAQKRVDTVNSGKATLLNAEKTYTNALRDIAYSEEDLAVMKENLEKRKTAQTLCDSRKDALDKATEENEAAIEEYNEADREFSAYSKVSDKTVSEARVEMTKAQEKAEEYEERYEKLAKKQLEYQEAQQNYKDAKAEYEELLKEGASEEALAEALAHRDEMFAIYQKKTRISDSEVETARVNYERYSEEAFRLEVEYDSLLNEQNEFEKDKDYIAAKTRYEKADSARAATKEALKKAQSAYDDAVRERDEIPAVSQSSINESERALTRSKSELTYHKDAYIEAVEEFTGESYIEGFDVDTAVKTELERAKAALTAAQNELYSKEDELSLAKDKLAEANDAYNDALKDAPSDKDELKKSITTMERQMKSLLEAQKQNRESQTLEAERHKLEVEKSSAAVEKQKKKVEALESETVEPYVKARYSGVITSVSVIAGDTANAGEDIVSIDVTGKGYTMQMPVSLEQSRYVKVGDTAKVLNYWGSGITVRLSEIRVDRSNQSGKILEFDVDGDVVDGQSLNISVGDRKNSYEYVVPNSAVREDANGTFIYIAEVKSTPIGNRFTARRLPVTVIAKDETVSALEMTGDYNNEFVIINSSSPLTDGMQVRLVD